MKNYTDIVCILDKSGSMVTLQGSTIKAFNSFLEEQKTIPGEASITVVTFNDKPEVVQNRVSLQDAVPLNTDTYRPAGYTALNDTLGLMIDETGMRLAALPESERPDKVVFFIITDGQENTSKIFTAQQIKEKILEQQNVYSWEFIFTAANIDAFATGASLGISAVNTSQYDATHVGTQAAYQKTSSVLRSIRTR